MGQTIFSLVIRINAFSWVFKPQIRESSASFSVDSLLLGFRGLKRTLPQPLTLNSEQRESKHFKAILTLPYSVIEQQFTPFASRTSTALFTVRVGSSSVPLELKRQFQALTADARIFKPSQFALAIECHLLWSNIFLWQSSYFVRSSLVGISRSQLGVTVQICLDESLGFLLGKPFPLNISEKSDISSSSSSTLFSLTPYSTELSINLKIITDQSTILYKNKNIITLLSDLIFYDYDQQYRYVFISDT